MSDGPHRTLSMSRPWKRVAEYADNNAYSADDVAGAYLPALERNCRDEVPEAVRRSLIDLFCAQQATLFLDQKLRDISALRAQVAGLPLGCALVDFAARAAANGQSGAESLMESMAQALLSRGARANRQVEEHWYRNSTEQRTNKIRDRLEGALKKAAVTDLARRMMDMSGAQSAGRLVKKRGLDEGPEIER